MEAELVGRHCTPCRGGVPPLTTDAISRLVAEVPGWTVIDGHHITRTFKLPDFAKALALVNKIGAVAEQEGHHPDIYLSWGVVRVDTWTHKINGLSENDFILAAKIDRAAAR